MKTKKNRGNYYKLRTRNWFRKKGYDCELSEKLYPIIDKDKITGETKLIGYRKSDIFGSDMIAMNGEEIIFANSKFGRQNITEGLKEFAKYPFPSCVKRWVVVWEFRAREPEIIEYEER